MIEAPAWVIYAMAAFGTCQWVRQLWATRRYPYLYPDSYHYIGFSTGRGQCGICHKMISGGSDHNLNRTGIMQDHLGEHHIQGHCICNTFAYTGPVIRPSEML